MVGILFVLICSICHHSISEGTSNIEFSSDLELSFINIYIFKLFFPHYNAEKIILLVNEVMNLIEFIYSHSNSLCQAENHNFKIQMLVGEKACFHFSTADQKEKEIVFRYLFYSKLKYRDCTLQ